MFGKKFRPNSVFDENNYPPPENLKKALELIAGSFNMNSNRNMDIMNTENQVLYGFITSYESNNFCWIQPTRTLDRIVKDEFHEYMKKINRDAKAGKLSDLYPSEYKIGQDILAQYEADGRWYRAMIVGGPIIEEKWLVIFIDYGNYQRCTTDQMAKPIITNTHNHYHPPMQAVCCRLYNIVPRLPDHRNDIDIEFEKFYVAHVSSFLELKVRNVRRDFIVDVDVFHCKVGTPSERRFHGKHIAQPIVDSGIASFADPIAAYAIMDHQYETITIDESDDEGEALRRKQDLKREVKQEIDEKLQQQQQHCCSQSTSSSQSQSETRSQTSSIGDFKFDVKVKIEPGTETKVHEPEVPRFGIKIKIEPGTEPLKKEEPVSPQTRFAKIKTEPIDGDEVKLISPPSPTSSIFPSTNRMKRGSDGTAKFINKPIYVNNVAFRPFG